MQNTSVIISMYNIIMVTLDSLFIVKKKGIKWIEIIGLRIRYLFNLFHIYIYIYIYIYTFFLIVILCLPKE